MKREIAMIAFILLGMGMTASAQFGKKVNLGKALQAGKDVVSAVTLSDADIANMSKEYMVWMDAHNPLTKPDTEYGKRLEKLTGHIKEVDGLKLNFGVYEVVDVNAFACGDGSVRICAGLMDVMTDEEVMAVVGHEIGHVVHTDSKDAMKNAYLRSAVKNAAGASSDKVAKLTDSELGAMAEALAGAQYSQKQESEADDYGVEFCVKNGIDPYAMANSLAKLVDGTHRKCYVINFAEDIHCMLIKDLRADFPLLADFLNYRFDGGTNMVPALKEAVRLIQTNGWHRSDVVMISDFEMPPVGDELMKQIMGVKHRDTSFYALVFGSRPEMDYLSICDRTWEMEIPLSAR